MKRKKIIIITFITVILILVTIYRFNKYQNIEKEYIAAAEYIYKENGIENAENVSKIILTRNEINYLLDDNPLDDKCNGYVIITNYENKPKYKSFISCKRFTTSGFDRKLLN